jgi:ketosteroid isomerase-like protein
MSTQTKVSDAERVAIEKEITEWYKKLWESAEKVDTSGWASMMSDAYNLGFISGVFYKSSKDVIDDFRESFKLRERQEILETQEFHLAVLAPDLVVVTDLWKATQYYKDGKTFTGNFANTYILAKLAGEWKLVHMHESFQKVE